MPALLQASVLRQLLGIVSIVKRICEGRQMLVASLKLLRILERILEMSIRGLIGK